MFLNPWYSGQQQQQPQPQPQDGNEASAIPTVNSHPENGVITDLKNINHGLSGGSGSSLSSGLSPAPSPRLPPRSLDNKNQQIEELQRSLRSGWTVHMIPDGRFYYCK